MRLVFVSLDPQFSGAACSRIGKEVAALNNDIISVESASDVRGVVPGSVTAYVSPANSLGYMDGGVDHVYSREMFPGVEAGVKSRIKELGLKTRLGRPYLPVGCAMLIDAADYDFSSGASKKFLVCTPTMFLPHDVSKTQNAYHAFLAVLTAVNKHNHASVDPIDALVCPGLCCGYGKMTVDDSVEQICRAFRAFFFDGKRADDVSPHKDAVICRDQQIVCDQQPDCFDNREIKDVDPTRI